MLTTLGWLIEGAALYCEKGLDKPEIVRTATADYLADQDHLSQWLEERCHADPHNRNLWSPADALFADFKEFMERRGEWPGTETSFGNDLTSLSFQKDRRFYQGQKRRGRLGIELLKD